jgi:hypothetical protein
MWKGFWGMAKQDVKKARKGTKARKARKVKLRRVPPAKERIGEIIARLKREYPDAKCALDHANPLQLLVATILSAQCTDVRVNIVTKTLFKKYPTAKAFANARPEEFEQDIRSTGFFRNKTKSVLGMANALLAHHHPPRPPDLRRAPAEVRDLPRVRLLPLQPGLRAAHRRRREARREVNQLEHAASAYLKSAAHQPVDWYPWGEPAFEKAAADDKPVLLDIGAVWCHWCHVMDGESYEDPDIAAYLNANYVCI